MHNDVNRESLPQLEVILATLLYLMSHYAESPTEELKRAVSEHFNILHTHPECKSKLLRDVGQRLHRQWSALNDLKTPKFIWTSVTLH